MSRHSGRFGKIFISGTAVGSIKSFKLSLKRKKTDVTCMGDANEVQVQGLPAVSGSYTGVWDDVDTAPFTAQASTTYVDMVLYLDYTNNPEKYAYGPAWLDIDIDTSVDKAVDISGDFSAAGNWGDTFGS
jgi:hypothetical protein